MKEVKHVSLTELKYKLILAPLTPYGYHTITLPEDVEFLGITGSNDPCLSYIKHTDKPEIEHRFVITTGQSQLPVKNYKYLGSFVIKPKFLWFKEKTALVFLNLDTF